MKKLLILLLALTVVVGLVACASESDESSAPGTSSTAASSSGTSSAAASSAPAASSAASSEEETSDPEPLDYEVAELISQYVGWNGSIGTGLTGVRASDATSLQLTAVNVSPTDGTASAIAFNSDFGGTIASDDGSYDDYNILVFEYDHSIFGYKMTDSKGVDDEDKDDVEIPSDGFVLAVHKHWQEKVDAMKAFTPEDSKNVFFPHGFRATDALDATIKSKTATVDGEVSESEYGAPVWEIEPEDIYCNYSQFASPLDVDVVAKVYMTYDSEYLYIGVVVDSPNHYLPNKDSLWRYDSIQVNVISIDPMSEDVVGSNYWDIIVNSQASSDNVFRQYGYGVTDAGESVAVVYMGSPTTTKSETICVRDDANQITTYEAKIPLSECGKEGETIVGEAGTVIGVSVSVNQGNEETWENVALRDGGGVIGLNDITKVPTITLG